ncbi:MAG: ABC transporter ATP-binding protein [Bacilli bacterium]
MEIVKVNNLTKTYGKGRALVKALNNVSFNIKKGEFIAIVGPSGSGKSTLLHILGGVDKPTSGEVIINNTNIYKLNNQDLTIFRRREIGLIYQFYNLIPILNVEENITLPILLDQKKVKEDVLKEIMETLKLKNRIKHLPNQLSGGEQQRVSIGRALISKPSIILADEPTGNLDSKTSSEIMSLLKMANEKYQQTIILVTHNLDLVKEVDRVISIADGKIISDQRGKDENN